MRHDTRLSCNGRETPVCNRIHPFTQSTNKLRAERQGTTLSALSEMAALTLVLCHGAGCVVGVKMRFQGLWVGLKPPCLALLASF